MVVESKAQEGASKHAAKAAQSPSQERPPNSAKSLITPEPALSIIEWTQAIEGFGLNRKKRRYKRSEAVKVTANRGYACEEHQRKKSRSVCL